MSEYSIANGRLYRNDVCLTNFVPEVLGVYGNPSEPKSQLIKIAYTIVGRDKPEFTLVFGNLLRQLNFEECDYACRYETTPSKARRWVGSYLCDQADNIIARGAYGSFLDTSGWYDLPSPAFAAGGGLTGMKPDGEVRLGEGISSTRLACGDGLDVGTAVTGLVTAFQRTPEAMMAFTFTLFTAMRSLLQQAGHPVNSVLYITGTQGFGKSQLARRYCTLFDDTTRRLPTNSFDAGSTFASIRDALAQQRDLVVLLDDLCHSSITSEEAKRRKLLSMVIRSATNITSFGKKAGNRNVEITCAAGLVVTAEMLPSAASELTRCVLLRLDHQLNDFEPTDRSFAAATFQHFLSWFAARQADELQQLRKDFDAFQAGVSNNREMRLQIALWQQSWVFDCFTRFAAEVGVVSQKAATSMNGVFGALLKKTWTDTTAEIDRLAPVRPESLTAFTVQALQRKVIPAIRHRGCLYVRLEELTQYLRCITRQPSLDPKAVSAALLDAGLLETDASGKNTKKLGGRRYLAISTTIIT